MISDWNGEMMKCLHAVILLWLLFCVSGCQRSFDSQVWQNDYSSRKSMLKSVEDLLVSGTSRQQVRHLLGHPPHIGGDHDLYFIEVGFDDIVSYLQIDFDTQDNLLRTKIVKIKAD